MGADAGLWRHVLPALRAERPVLAYDLRGHGAAAGPGSGPYRIADHAGDLLARLDETAPDGGPVHVLGTSLGGVIAQVAAAEAPQQFASLVLCATWGAAPPGLDAEGLAAAIAAAPDMRVHFAGLVRAMLPSHPDDAALLLDALAAADRDALVQGARELFAWDGTALLPGIRVPALCVAGDRDDVFTPAAAQALAAALPDARSGVLTGCGHAPYVERPAMFAHVVAEFWREHDPAAA